MAELNPRIPQVNDPELEVALNRLLTIVGPVGRLNVADTVIPTVNLGTVTPLTVTTEAPAFTVGEQFSNGAEVAPAASFIFADTGQLITGTFDLVISLGTTGNANDAAFGIEHRNAANSANLFRFDLPLTGGTAFSMTFATTFIVNERLRILISTTAAAGERWAAAIFAKRRV